MFSTSSSTTVGNGASTCSDLCAPSGDCSITAGNGFKDNAHTSNPFNKGKRLGGEPSILVRHAQRMGGNSYG
jgi:hypothetical protein